MRVFFNERVLKYKYVRALRIYKLWVTYIIVAQ